MPELTVPILCVGLLSLLCCGAVGDETGHPVEEFGRELPIVMDLGVGGTMAARVVGEKLYSIGSGRMRVFDISSPGDPRLISTLEGVPNGRQIELAGGVAYITARENGVFIADVSDDENPELLCHYDPIEVATGVDVSGDVLFIACRSHGVELVDVRDPARPRHLGTARTGEAQSVVVRNGYAYTGVWGSGELVVVDVRNPRRPEIASRTRLDGYGDGVTVRGDYVFIATGHHARLSEGSFNKPGDEGFGRGHGLEIFDISDPAQPVFVSRIKMPRFYRIGMDMWGVKIAGDYAFVHDTYNGVFVINIADPANPRFVAHRQLPYVDRKGDHLPAPVGNLALARDYIYVCGAWSDLHVVEAEGLALPEAREPDTPPVIPPFEPREVEGFRVYTTAGQVRGVDFVGDIAVVASGADGIHVVRVWPEFERLHHYPTEGFAMDVATHGRLALVAEDKGGLSIWRMEDDYSLTQVGRYRQGSRVIRNVFIPPGGKYAVLTVTLARLDIIDFSDPAQPVSVLQDSGYGVVYQVVRQLREERYLYVNWQIDGIFAYDLYGGPTPTAAEETYPHRIGHGALLLDDTLLMFDWSGIIPIVRGEQRPPQDIERIRADGQRPRGAPYLCGDEVYLASRTTGDITVLDFADMNAPTIVDRYNIPGNPGALAFHDGSLAIANGYEGRWVKDIE